MEISSQNALRIRVFGSPTTPAVTITAGIPLDGTCSFYSISRHLPSQKYTANPAAQSCERLVFPISLCELKEHCTGTSWTATARVANKACAVTAERAGTGVARAVVRIGARTNNLPGLGGESDRLACAKSNGITRNKICHVREGSERALSGLLLRTISQPLGQNRHTYMSKLDAKAAREVSAAILFRIAVT
jgi:hypothetical protein